MRRTKVKTVTFTEEEYEQIKRSASQIGLSVSAYLRTSALKGGIK